MKINTGDNTPKFDINHSSVQLGKYLCLLFGYIEYLFCNHSIVLITYKYIYITNWRTKIMCAMRITDLVFAVPSLGCSKLDQGCKCIPNKNTVFTNYIFQEIDLS